MFLTIQAVFGYILFSYPKFVASLFAANYTIRTASAAGNILFAQPPFINLCVHKDVSVLAGLTVVGIPGMISIYAFGKKFCGRSVFPQK